MHLSRAGDNGILDQPEAGLRRCLIYDLIHRYAGCFGAAVAKHICAAEAVSDQVLDILGKGCIQILRRITLEDNNIEELTVILADRQSRTLEFNSALFVQFHYPIVGDPHFRI